MGGQMELNSFDYTRKSYIGFERVIRTISELSHKIKTISGLLHFSSPMRKTDTQFMEYYLPERKVERPFHNDRVFPLETVEIQGFRTKTDMDLDTAIIHTGPYADEYARSFNALAVTIANEIYFRNGAYDPASEEGRKILAHELTHIGQYTEKRITKNITEKELEEEAEQAEKHEISNFDPYVVVNINGSNIRLRKSEMKKYAACIADNIEEWIEEQKNTLSEEEYLELLYGIRNWLSEAI